MSILSRRKKIRRNVLANLDNYLDGVREIALAEEIDMDARYLVTDVDEAGVEWFSLVPFKRISSRQAKFTALGVRENLADAIVDDDEWRIAVNTIIVCHLERMAAL